MQTLIPLTPFQQDWINDKSRFKIAAKSRRVGFTFGSTLEIALDVIDHRTKWLIVSRTQDTAKEALEEIRNHFAAMQLVAEASVAIEEIPTDLFFRDARLTKFQIELPNKSRMQGLTSHPDAARGFGGNVLLDEYGFHNDSKELWKGVHGATLRGHRILVVSTPNYQQGYYYELARNCGLTTGRAPTERRSRLWSAHWVDIYRALPQLQAIGVPVSIDDLRETAGDEEAFQQEFCCQFLSASEMWIPLELIAAARSSLATLEWDPYRPVEGDLYAGVDIGRRHDRTVMWVDEVISGVAITRGVITLAKTPFREQYQVLRGILSHPKLRRACLDETGVGMQMAEDAQREFGYRVEPVTFTQAAKEDMSVTVRRRFKEKLDKIPENAPAIERAIAAVKREATASGALRFDAARTEQGHADEYWAKALADRAHDSKSTVGPPEFVSSGVLRPSAQLAGAW